jgi:MFS family permease
MQRSGQLDEVVSDHFEETSEGRWRRYLHLPHRDPDRIGTWAPMRVRNYRLFFSGQIISVPGTWLQTIAQAWLVLQLSSSGSALGFTVALQSLPVLLLGPWGGTVADRVDKRLALIGTQLAQGLLALILGLLTATGVVELWMVWVLAFGLGLARSVDSPVRQSFVSEMVESRLLPRAIALNSVIVSAARAIGPASGGLIIAAFGVAPCFLINAGSFIAVIGALLAMNRDELRRSEPVKRTPGMVREGFRYVSREPKLRAPLLMMVLVGTFAYEFQVSLPLLAHETFQSGAAGFGLLYACMGVGAVTGGLTIAGKLPIGVRTQGIAAAAFGVLLAGVAISPTMLVAGLLLLFAGAASVTFTSTTNSSLQLRSLPSLRGRVMALYLVAFMGSTPIGGPIVGWVGEQFGARWSIGIGAAACGLAAVMAARTLARYANGRSAATSASLGAVASRSETT